MINLTNLADKPSESVSNKYQFINSKDLVSNFEKQGFSVSKFAGKGQTAKHFIRLRRPDFQFKNVGDCSPEIVIYNSYDASSAFRIMFGIFRLVCSNGLVVPAGLSEHHRVVHLGDAIERVNNCIPRVVSDLDRVETLIHHLGAIELDETKQAQFANVLFRIFYPKAMILPQTTEALLTPTRVQDVGNSAWLTLNRVQERLIHGGVPYWFNVETKHGTELKKQTTRRIQGAASLLLRNESVFNGILELTGTRVA